MTSVQLVRVKTITEYHRLANLPKPVHPLISVIDFESFERPISYERISLIFDFYSVSLKRNLAAKFKYGQQTYDFDEGVMFFMSPGQVFGVEFDKAATEKPAGWMILVHPDFLWNTPLAKIIKRYEYFDYSVNEALYLSDKEEAAITNLARNIEQEYRSNIDKFSHSVIVAQFELLLIYADRFYQRQFITRKIANHQILKSSIVWRMF